MVEVIYSHFAAFELSLNFMICLNQDDLRSHPISYKPTVFWWGAFKKQKSRAPLLCWLTGVTCTKLTSLLETLAMFNMAIVHWYRICIIKYIYKENTSACAYVQFCGRNCWYTLHSHIWATCSTWEKRSKFITAIWTLRATKIPFWFILTLDYTAMNNAYIMLLASFIILCVTSTSDG